MTMLRLACCPSSVLRFTFFRALTSHDVWQFGIVLFVCLTGCLPWQKAALDDRSTVHQISELAQRDAEHSQETEIISADQLAGAEVSLFSRIWRQLASKLRGTLLITREIPFFQRS